MRRSISINGRLYIALSSMTVMMAVVAMSGYWGMMQASAAHRDTYESRMVAVESLSTAVVKLLLMRVALDRAVLDGQGGGTHGTLEQIEGQIAEANAAWKEYLLVPKAPGEQHLVDDIDAKREKFLTEGVGAVISALRGERVDEAREVASNKAVQLYGSLSDARVRLVAGVKESARNAYESAERSILVVKAVTGGLVALALLVGLAAYIGLRRAIATPIGKAVNACEAVAKGDLSSEIVVHADDEIGRLTHALREMQGRLVLIVRSVKHSAGAVRNSAEQLEDASTDLARRSREQAESLERTAASLEQLGSAVSQNSDNARAASVAAEDAARITEASGEVVRRTADSMRTIQEKAARVSEITGVIEGIAFQTNILALNAAVEAARAAGEGKGFGVVAAEVRELAQRSSTAAKEIREIIADCVAEVARGTQLAEMAGSTMAEALSIVGKVSALSSQIRDASVEQSAGLDQVSQAAMVLDDIGRENLALVTFAVSATDTLLKEAAAMQSEVAVFQLSQPVEEVCT